MAFCLHVSCIIRRFLSLKRVKHKKRNAVLFELADVVNAFRRKSVTSFNQSNFVKTANVSMLLIAF